MKLCFKSLAELVAFRNKYNMLQCRARWGFAPSPYFVHAERDDLDQRLWRHTTFRVFTAPFGRPRAS